MPRVVNIGATALVTDAATAIFGEAGVSAATGVMTVCLKFLFYFYSSVASIQFEIRTLMICLFLPEIWSSLYISSTIFY